MDDIVAVSDSKMGLGDYVRLPQSDDPELGRSTGVQAQCSSRKRSAWVWWIKVALLCLFLLAGAALFIIFAGPLLIKKVSRISLFTIVISIQLVVMLVIDSVLCDQL